MSSCRAYVTYEPSFDWRRLGNCFAVFSWIGDAVVHPGGKIPPDGLATTNFLGEVAKNFDLVAALRECGADIRGSGLPAARHSR